MNPTDALPADWSMYYDCCWMEHVDYGIGRVRVIGGDLYFEKELYDDVPEPVKAEDLVCWWPRPGAFNVRNGTAIYIARRTIRNMRKSAVGSEHYFLKWGSWNSSYIMSILKDGPNCIPVDQALADMEEGIRTSAAIGRDVILEKTEKDRYTVIFRGMEVGTWENGFVPYNSVDPLTDRINRQLERIE